MKISVATWAIWLRILCTSRRRARAAGGAVRCCAACIRTLVDAHLAVGVAERGQQVELDARLGGERALQVRGARVQRPPGGGARRVRVRPRARVRAVLRLQRCDLQILLLLWGVI